MQVLDGDRVRLLLSTTATRARANLEGGGAMALTTTHFATNVSWQLKGRVEAIEPATAADRIRFDAFCAGAVALIHAGDGAPEEIIWRLAPPGIVACELSVAQVFDQTPGPGAGARVAPVEA